MLQSDFVAVAGLPPDPGSLHHHQDGRQGRQHLRPHPRRLGRRRFRSFGEDRFLTTAVFRPVRNAVFLSLDNIGIGQS